MKFLYVRVSSIGQHTERQLLTENDFDRIYIDKCSGKDRERPELKAMLSNLRSGDEITCHSLDRLARDTFDLLSLVKEITNKGCSIVFLKENLRFEPEKNNAINNLMMQILASIAEFERNLIKTRQAEGIAIAKAKGKFKGKGEKLEKDAAEELRDLLKGKKISIKEAMKRYNLSRASVYNYLHRESKKGAKDGDQI